MAAVPKHRSELSVSRKRVEMGSALVPETFVLHLFDFEDGSPNIDVTWQVVDGSPVCREVRIVAVDTDHEVNVSGLAGVRIEDLLEQTVRALLWTGDLRHGEESEFPSGATARQVVREVREVRTGRKVKVTDDLLREVAEVYRANVDDNPTQAVAEHLGKQPRTARLYVKRAREAGFLGAAIKGKAGEQ